MATEEQAPVSEAQIAVHWREEEYYSPPAKFIAQANAADPRILDEFGEAYFPECFREYADLPTWMRTGTRHWTPVPRRSGSGSSAVA